MSKEIFDEGTPPKFTTRNCKLQQTVFCKAYRGLSIIGGAVQGLQTYRVMGNLLSTTSLTNVFGNVLSTVGGATEMPRWIGKWTSRCW